MKKKQPQPSPEVESVVDESILLNARLSISEDRPRNVARCVICGSEAAPTSTEELCWVCRRLKISAWRDTDSQSAVQE